jgi:hypothetical protein
MANVGDFVLKRGHSLRKNWKQRFVVFNPSAATLSYYAIPGVDGKSLTDDFIQLTDNTFSSDLAEFWLDKNPGVLHKLVAGVSVPTCRPAGCPQVTGWYDIPDRAARKQHRIDFTCKDRSEFCLSFAHADAKSTWVAYLSRHLPRLNIETHPRFMSFVQQADEIAVATARHPTGKSESQFADGWVVWPYSPCPTARMPCIVQGGDALPVHVEHDEAYVVVPHGSKFQIEIENPFYVRCSMTLEIDGHYMGGWILGPRETVVIERPPTIPKRFTFLQETWAVAAEKQATRHAPAGSGILANQKSNGLITCCFTPERLSWSWMTNQLGATAAAMAGDALEKAGDALEKPANLWQQALQSVTLELDHHYGHGLMDHDRWDDGRSHILQTGSASIDALQPPGAPGQGPARDQFSTGCKAPGQDPARDQFSTGGKAPGQDPARDQFSTGGNSPGQDPAGGQIQTTCNAPGQDPARDQFSTGGNAPGQGSAQDDGMISAKVEFYAGASKCSVLKLKTGIRKTRTR